MYEMKIQVRYSETDQNGRVKLHQILEYFQDCVTFHSMAVGLGIRGDKQEDRAWYLIAWNIRIHRYPQMAENLTIVTEPYKMHGFYGYRVSGFWTHREQCSWRLIPTGYSWIRKK